MWKPTYIYSWPSKNELYHHGILGMKWGKKNGPPYPLGSEDHSAAEKKAGWRKSLGGGNTSSTKDKKKQQKEFVKNVIKRQSNQSIDTYDRQLVEDIKKAVNPEKMKAFKDATEKLHKIDKLYEDFWDSEERYNASAKAYDDTYNYFQKEDPEWLSRIIKDNGGKKTGLDAYHDFRKTYEGFEDDAWDKAEKDYLKNHGFKDGETFTTVFNECRNARNEVVKDIVGKYGNKLYRNKGTKRQAQVKQLVGSYLNDIKD